MRVAVGQKTHSLIGHFHDVRFLMVNETAFGEEGKDKLGDEGEFESDEERHKLEGGDIGETTTLESDQQSPAPASQQCHQ
jgi:hypothetical protein